MKNQTDPLQILNNYHFVKGKENKWNKREEIRLSVNEFSDKRDLFGFLTDEPKIHNFLAVDTRTSIDLGQDLTLKYGFSV